MVRARLAQVRGDVVEAEHVLIEHGKVDEAIDMYHSLQRWEDAIAVAEAQAHSQASHMKEQYFQVGCPSTPPSSVSSHIPSVAARRRGRCRAYVSPTSSVPCVVVLCCAVLCGSTCWRVVRRPRLVPRRRRRETTAQRSTFTSR
jgi:hypothetical protein